MPRRRRGADALRPTLLTTPQATYTQVGDFTTGSHSLATFANATGASATTSGGKTRLSWTSATSGQYTGVKLEGSWDFSASDLFALDVAQPTAGYDLVNRIAVFFCFDTGTTFNNYATLASNHWPVKRGSVPIRKSTLSVTGVANWAAVRRIEIRYVKASTATATLPVALDLYGFYSHVVPPKTKVILSFDDAHGSVYDTAFPYMTANGMVGTFFLNGSVVGGVGSITAAEIAEMHAAGWEFPSHTYTHLPLAKGVAVTRSGQTVTATVALNHGLSVGNSVTIEGGDQPEYTGTFTVDSVISATQFTYTCSGTPATPGTGYRVMTLAPSAYLSDLRLQVAWAPANSVARSDGVFAYPYGHYSAQAMSDLASFGVRAARTVESYLAPHPAGSVTTYFGLLDPMRVPTVEMMNTSTAATILGYVDAALPFGAAVNIYGHKVEAVAGDSTTIATAEFQALIDGLKTRVDAGTIEVVPFRRWIEGR